MNENDTIAAIATAHGQGAIGIVRLSGAGALEIIKRVFSPAPSPFESHRMYYGKIHKADEVIDEVMLCYMKSPRSFTREDCVEIFAHGGMFVLNRVLSTIIENGARLALPGEFTKRAFLNGRVNLAEAEAVMDLIGAKSEAARRTALRQIGGGLSRRVESVRDKILSWLAHIELSIDYPEHEDEAKNLSQILSESGGILSDLQSLSQTAATGRIIREGVRAAIIGRPNVGKSTLLNAILSENRAIVHESAGTTRDILTEQIRIGDVPLVITDTAGLRSTTDPIEQIGIQKTNEAAQDAELIFFVADATQGLTEEDISLIQGFEQKLIVLMNKSDLREETILLDGETGSRDRFRGNASCVHGAAAAQPLFYISAKTGEGLEDVFACMKKMFLTGGVGAGGETEIITRERHRVLLEQAGEYVRRATREIGEGVPEDLVSVSLRAAYIALGEILGIETGDDIVERIFAEFCVGK